MRCCKQAILLALLSFLLLPLQLQGQDQPPTDPRFEALVNEQMMVFTKRDVWQKPAFILELMAIEPTEQVADIGAGEGYFSLKLADQVGPDGKVFAKDIDASRLNKLRLLKRYAGLEQIDIKQNTPTELGLQSNSLDKIVMIKTYHQVASFEAILGQCKEALKPDGKLYIIDSCVAKLDNDKATIKKLAKKNSIRLPMVTEELERAGFQIDRSIDKYTIQNGSTNWFIVVASKN